MSVVVLLSLFAVVGYAFGLLVSMFVQDKPFHGALAICLLSGPGTALAFLHLTLA